MAHYSVILIDDESLILESLQSLIDWAQLDCFIAGTAKNGRQGLKLIRRLRPHIVVTDIKMPDVSGIEIAEFCAQQLPGTKLIVLSAYADFVFAQSAMRAGASNYLLKPLSRNELACAVQKVVSELNTAERSMASRSLAETDFENAKTLATSSLLFNLARYGTSGSWRVDDDWVREKIEAGSVVVMGTFFNLTCSIAPALAIGQTHVHQWLHHAGYNPIFGSADENLILLCTVAKGIDYTTARNRLIQTLREFLRTLPEKLGVGVFCVSDVYSTGDMLQRCYRDCLSMLRCGFFCSTSSVISHNRAIPAAPPGIDPQEFIFALKHGRPDMIEVLLSRWKQILLQQEDEQFALEKMREWSRIATLCAAKLGMDSCGLWIHEYEHENFDTRFECMRRGILAVCTYAKKKVGNISRTCLYVEEHYGNRDLNLEAVATELGLNSSYLSRAFKKEMNENFSEYLVRIRIERAQKLLRETDMRTYAIAEEVGFWDAHYFSQVFKKRCGMSPAEYRTSVRKDKNFTT